MNVRRIAALLSAATLTGCGQDTRPAYQVPRLDPTQMAMLRGVKGWFIDGVDGARVDHSNFSVGLLGPSGGNEVVVVPGKHHVNAVFHGGGQLSDGSGDVSRVFEPGHTYQFRSQNAFFGAQTLRVIDLGGPAPTAP